jgi:hypothetical protein
MPVRKLYLMENKTAAHILEKDRMENKTAVHIPVEYQRVFSCLKS